jgi:hypothetical protein
MASLALLQTLETVLLVPQGELPYSEHFSLARARSAYP